MSDDKPTSPAKARGVRPTAPNDDAELSRRQNYTIKGGRYIVDGRVVDANGKELDELTEKDK